jgi:hypothetical protein
MSLTGINAIDQYETEGEIPESFHGAALIQCVGTNELWLSNGVTTERVGSNMDNSSNSNYSFAGNMIAGAGKYNLYMAGTADNYMAGSLGIGNTPSGTYKLEVTGSISGTTLTSTVATGTAPFVVASTTNVANLNASSLSGATFAAPGAIGSTTASTGAFTNLSYTGTLTGSTGVLNIGSGQIYKDASGNVGIGTTLPKLKTHIQGGFSSPTTSGTTPTGTFLLDATSGGYGLYAGIYGSGSLGPWLQVADKNALGGYGDIAINPLGGNVGIGTSSPSALRTRNLEVSSSGTNDGAAVIVGKRGTGVATVRLTGLDTTVGTDINFNYPNTGDLSFFDRASSVTRMVINSSGNVGIGTSSPTYKLDVQGGNVNLTGSFYAKSNSYFGVTNVGCSMQHYTSSNWNYSNLDLWRNATNTSTPRFLGMPLDGDSGSSTTIGGYNAIWGAYDSAPTTGSTSSGLNGTMVYGAYAGHRWYTNGTEKMRIDSSGNVGIGTSSPSSYGRFVSKQSADTSIAALGLVAQASTTDTFISMGYSSVTDTTRIYSSYLSTGAFKPISFWTSDAERMRIDSSGNVGIGTSSPTGKLDVAGTIKTLGYTVATLPTGVVGARAYVTDALAPVFGATVVTGGAVTIPVFYNGTNWIVG